jgi:hypothetical protein
VTETLGWTALGAELIAEKEVERQEEAQPLEGMTEPDLVLEIMLEGQEEIVGGETTMLTYGNATWEEIETVGQGDAVGKQIKEDVQREEIQVEILYEDETEAKRMTIDDAEIPFLPLAIETDRQRGLDPVIDDEDTAVLDRDTDPDLHLSLLLRHHLLRSAIVVAVSAQRAAAEGGHPVLGRQRTVDPGPVLHHRADTAATAPDRDRDLLLLEADPSPGVDQWIVGKIAVSL